MLWLQLAWSFLLSVWHKGAQIYLNCCDSHPNLRWQAVIQHALCLVYGSAVFNIMAFFVSIYIETLWDELKEPSGLYRPRRRWCYVDLHRCPRWIPEWFTKSEQLLETKDPKIFHRLETRDIWGLPAYGGQHSCPVGNVIGVDRRFK